MSVTFTDQPIGQNVGEKLVEDQDGRPLRGRQPGTVVHEGLGGPRTEVVDQTRRSLADAARARAAAIAENRAKAGTAAPKPAAAPPPADTAPIDTAKPAEAAPPAEVEVIETGAAAPDDADDGVDPDLKVDPAKAKPVAAAPPSVAEPPELEHLRATIERQTKMLEQAKATVDAAAKAQQSAAATRADLMRETEDVYYQGPAAAARQWVAGILGVADPSAKEVDSEIDDLIADLISARNGVALDPAHQANRKSALLQRAWNREKERATGKHRDTEDQKQRDEREQKVQAAQGDIAQRLGANRDKHPHLVALAQTLDGVKPEEKIWAVIKRGVELGTIDPNDSDERIFATAAGIAEKFYQARAEQLRGALNIGTAAPKSQPAKEQAGAAATSVTDDRARQGHGSRSLTNADASVAPARTGKQPVEPETPRVETSEEKRRRVIAKHMPGHPAGRPR